MRWKLIVSVVTSVAVVAIVVLASFLWDRSSTALSTPEKAFHITVDSYNSQDWWVFINSTMSNFESMESKLDTWSNLHDTLSLLNATLTVNSWEIVYQKDMSAGDFSKISIQKNGFEESLNITISDFCYIEANLTYNSTSETIGHLAHWQCFRVESSWYMTKGYLYDPIVYTPHPPSYLVMHVVA